MLGRLGIGHITAVDGDIFTESNLNRQLLCTNLDLGKNKALEAMERMKTINDLIKVEPIPYYINEDNAIDILGGHDVVIDALDNIETRFLLQDKCEKLCIPLVHGAISGWHGQATTIFPGDKTLNLIYKDNQGISKILGNPSFTPPLIASIQVTETLKILLNRGELLRHKLLLINLLTCDLLVASI